MGPRRGGPGWAGTGEAWQGPSDKHTGCLGHAATWSGLALPQGPGGRVGMAWRAGPGGLAPSHQPPAGLRSLHSGAELSRDVLGAVRDVWREGFSAGGLSPCFCGWSRHPGRWGLGGPAPPSVPDQVCARWGRTPHLGAGVASACVHLQRREVVPLPDLRTEDKSNPGDVTPHEVAETRAGGPPGAVAARGPRFSDAATSLGSGQPLLRLWAPRVGAGREPRPPRLLQEMLPEEGGC